MSKHHAYPPKHRSAAQKAQLASAVALRMQHRATEYTSQTMCPNHPDPRLKWMQMLRIKDQKLEQKQYELTCTRRREHRAKSKAARLQAKLRDTAQAAASESRRAEVLLKAYAGFDQVVHKEDMLTMELQNLQETNKQQQLELAAKDNTIQVLRTELEALKKQQDNNMQAAKILAETRAKLLTMQTRFQKLRWRNTILFRCYDTLRKRRARANAVPIGPPYPLCTPYPLTLKNSAGTIRTEVRGLVQQLTADGVSTEHMQSVIKHTLDTFGFSLADSISARSVSRIVLEGLLQSEIQIAHELSQTDRGCYGF